MVRKSRSLVAGDSGGTIRRYGGDTWAGHGTGRGVAQPASKLAPTAISVAQSRLEVTLHPLAFRVSGPQGLGGGLCRPRPVCVPLRLDSRRAGLVARPVRRTVAEPPGGRQGHGQGEPQP